MTMSDALLACAPQGLSIHKCFTVYCAGEVFGLSVDYAQTIFRVSAVTPIPLGRPEIIGLINLRGKIVTAVSLRQRLGLPDSEVRESGLAIGLEHNSENFALVVDQVGDVLDLSSDMRMPIPPHFDPRRLQLTSGLYRVGGQLIPILDVSAVLGFE